MDGRFVIFAIRDDCKSKELKNGTDAPLFYGQGRLQEHVIQSILQVWAARPGNFGSQDDCKTLSMNIPRRAGNEQITKGVFLWKPRCVRLYS